jgi:hypothetical protein
MTTSHTRFCFKAWNLVADNQADPEVWPPLREDEDSDHIRMENAVLNFSHPAHPDV